MCEKATPIEQLGDFEEGEVVTAKGEVVCARQVGGDFFLNLGEDYPNQVFTIVIWDDYVPNRNTPPDAKYDHRVVG